MNEIALDTHFLARTVVRCVRAERACRDGVAAAAAGLNTPTLVV